MELDNLRLVLSASAVDNEFPITLAQQKPRHEVMTVGTYSERNSKSQLNQSGPADRVVSHVPLGQSPLRSLSVH